MALDKRDLSWSSSVTSIEPNEIRLRGYRLESLMGQVRFADVIFLALTGDLPTKAVGDLIDTILVSSIDHGTTPPSALAARTATSTGAPLNTALAAGILSINKFHGGAVEGAMQFFNSSLKRLEGSDKTISELAEQIAKETRESLRRVPGYGHRIHSSDPRTGKLFDVAKEKNLYGKHAEFCEEFQIALAKATGKQLPINVDGAIAALLCDLAIPTEIANAFFIMARVPGLVAHIFEEKKREKVMRRIHPTNSSYDGVPPREL